MTDQKYILVNNKLKKVDLMTWAMWFQDATSPGRITGKTTIKGVDISTVFLGLDHSFSSKDKPVLWETMIFGSKHPALQDYQVRYSSLKDAIKGHEDAVRFADKILSTKIKSNVQSKKLVSPRRNQKKSK